MAGERQTALARARQAIEDALRAIDDDLLGEAWLALKAAQSQLEEAGPDGRGDTGEPEEKRCWS